jgi:hypothetical protein
MVPIKITQQNSNHICYTISYRFRALLGLLPATTKGEIIEIPQPNWHFKNFSSSNFTVQDRILSSTGDALTEVNRLNPCSRAKVEDIYQLPTPNEMSKVVMGEGFPSYGSLKGSQIHCYCSI